MRDPETGRLDEDRLGEKAVTGYADRWSVQPGETIEFKVSCEGPDRYRAAVVKLRCGDTNPDGPGYRETVVGTDADADYPARTQALFPGSHVRVDDCGRLGFEDGFTLAALVNPTTPDRGVQGLLTRWDGGTETGYGLFVDETGSASLWLGGSDDAGEESAVRASTDVPFEPATWYVVAAAYDPGDGVVRLRQHPLPSAMDGRLASPAASDGDATVEASLDALAVPDVPVVFAGTARLDSSDTTAVAVDRSYNGKLERPTAFDRPLSGPELDELVEAPAAVLSGTGAVDPGTALADAAEPVATWDFAAEVTDDGVRPPDRVTDRGPHGMDGEAVHAPARAVPGCGWTGEVHDYRRVPEQYGAIHFHEDDLIDAGWETDFAWTVPEGTESGVYAARLRTDDDEFHVTFAVRPPRGTTTADVAFLLPTNSYLAYANYHYKTDASVENGFGLVPTFDDGHLFKSAHREYGVSLYETHPDGHGSMYSSRLRPIINTTSPKATYGGAPPSHLHQLAADLYVVDWFEATGIEYDVVTDRDLHEEGRDLLSRYNCVVSGHHAEYYTRDQLDALTAYQDDGGRFVSLCGNGYYWAIAYHPDDPRIIEIRRGEDGNTPWLPEPGELHHAYTGEKGGIWRNLGRPPQALVGVGYCAQWDSKAGYYRRNPDSYEPPVSFVFDGVDGETIGDYGLLGGGAAGGEVDRYDRSLGSPDHAYVLASSEGHTEYMRQVGDEVPHPEQYVDARMNPQARADLVYYRTPNDGAVFSVGSMFWVGSLAHDDYDNDVARITENVVRRFAADGPLPPDPRYESG